ncbi:MAG: GNAT family N-acetyltransferase [Pseudomonadota bacterium]
MQLTHRIARPEDAPALDLVMNAAIAELQKGFLSPEQVESSRMIMGLDRQLLADGTYFMILAEDGRVAGCGGWSRRATLYGGDHTPGRDAALLDPAVDAARVRAMYTHPDFVRRGVGRMILGLCEDAAKAEGFSRLELMATLAGRALYSQCGYEDIEAIEDARGGAPVPMVRMGKAIP